MKVFGINNCNTVKKAKDWLNAKNIAYEFIDFKKHHLTEKEIQEWLTKVPLEQLINRKGTTWRMLSEDEKKCADILNSAMELMIRKPSLIKRPVIVYQEKNKKMVLLGFDEKHFETHLESV